MDRPDLPVQLHEHALDGLTRLNRWSGSDRILWQPIRKLAAETRSRPLKVLDVACGAGDVLVGLARRARRASIALDLHGIDFSPTAIGHARRRAAAAGVASNLWQADAFAGPLPDGFDVVACSLFVHHLTDDQAVDLLKRMAAATRRLVLVNDLRRSVPGWLLAVTACRLLTRSRVVHADGPLSVARAFTRAEVQDLADRAGFRKGLVQPRWPFRILLTWDRAA
jgi:2-polyprenyl-3-methyl-5-hydroxy-6-metoxy-1,4-benzoquinol methylase